MGLLLLPGGQLTHLHPHPGCVQGPSSCQAVFWMQLTIPALRKTINYLSKPENRVRSCSVLRGEGQVINLTGLQCLIQIVFKIAQQKGSGECKSFARCGNLRP